jgi:hypothetical protein
MRSAVLAEPDRIEMEEDPAPGTVKTVVTVS